MQMIMEFLGVVFAVLINLVHLDIVSRIATIGHLIAPNTNQRNESDNRHNISLIVLFTLPIPLSGFIKVGGRGVGHGE